MSNIQTNLNQEVWVKVLGKGMVTLPKKWRDELGIENGDIVKARKEGKRVILEPQKPENVPYRVYSDDEIETFLKDDQLPEPFIKKVREKIKISS